MNKFKELSSKKNVIVGIEPWKIELLWSYMRDLAIKVDSVLDSWKWWFHSTLNEGSAYTQSWSQWMAFAKHEWRVSIITDFLKEEIENRNIRIEDGWVKSPESLQRKRKRMRQTEDPETYLQDLSRLRVVCKDFPTLLRILKRFCLYIGYINPWNLFLSRAIHRFSPKARPTIFPSVYLYLWEFSSWKIPILEQQLDSLKAKRDPINGWQSWIESDTDEWKKAETQWNALHVRIQKIELQIKTEFQRLKTYGVSTEVQFMTENARTVAETNRKEYLVGHKEGEVVDFTEYNRSMLEVVMLDIAHLNENK